MVVKLNPPWGFCVKLNPFLLLSLFALAAPSPAEVVIDLEAGGEQLADNLRARLSLQQETCESPLWRVRRLFQRAEKEFTPALRAFGYYRPQVDKDLLTEGECWRATFRVSPGERTTVRQRTVSVSGEASTDDDLQKLLAGLPLAEGAPLEHAQYDQIKERLRTFAADYGYLDFAFKRQELRIYPEQAAAEILIEADSGRRYRFGELRLSEQPLDEEFLRRLGKFKPGAKYSAAALIALDRQLSDAGYYQRVEVRARRDEAVDGVVPVDVLLEPAKRHAWRAGIGFSTDTGPRLSLRYDNRYLNASGHRFESELRLSPVESGLKADYLVPGRDPHRESFSFGAGLVHEETDTVISDSISLVARQTLKSKRWTQTRFIELLHEQSQTGNDSSTSTLLMPGLGLERIKADDLLRTRSGYRVNLEVRGAYEGLISTATMLQLRANAKGIHRFGEGGRVVARVDAGSTFGDGTLELPTSLRFFAGGDNSVRGYAYKSLGPVDEQGDPVGGRHLLTGSIEYEHPVFGEDWWVAAFADGGNAFDTDRIKMRAGYGVGARWYSPIGRVRLDLAFPSDDKKDAWRLHFGLGADL